MDFFVCVGIIVCGYVCEGSESEVLFVMVGSMGYSDDFLEVS